MAAPPPDDLTVSADGPPEEVVERPRPITNLYDQHIVRTGGVRLHHAVGRVLPGWGALGFLASVLFVVFLWRLAGSTLEVGEADRRILPTAERFAAVARSFRVERGAGAFAKRRELDGTVLLEYTYSAPGAGQPEIEILCWIEDTEAEAQAAFRLTNAHTMIDWRLGRADMQVGLVWLDEGAPWSDESRVYRVERDGAALGHSVAFRTGTKTVYARIEGLVLDKAVLYRLFLPTVLGLRSYRAI